MLENPLNNEDGFDSGHYSELMMTAYDNRNYEESYRYATLLIEHDSARANAVAWVYKGLSAGMLSEPARPRIKEMINYIEKALDIDQECCKSALRINAALQVARSVSDFTWYVLSSFAQSTQRQVDSRLSRQSPTPVVVSGQSTSETIGRNIGAGIGAGIAQSIIQDSETRKQGLRSGTRFRNDYQEDIVAGLQLAWLLDQSESVASQILGCIGAILDTNSINPAAKQPLLDDTAELREDIKKHYGHLAQPQLGRSSYVACPRCGYSNIVVHRGQCLDIVLLVFTAGLWLLVMWFRKPAPVKVGDKLTCNTCDHEWVYRG